MRVLSFTLALLICGAGCDLAQPKNKREYVEPVRSESTENAASPPETEQEQGQEQPQVEPEPATQLVKADVGAGKKGHYGQKGGDGNLAESATDIITVPVATLFRAKEMAAYRIQVPQALQLYKAMNDGKGPATHDEFMKEIIEKERIPLPELPDGQRYVYDPETEELMIEKPR